MTALTGSQDPIKIPQLPCGSVKDFIQYIGKNQNTPVATLLEPFKSFESELRKVYAQQPDHKIAKDGHVNMVPIFAGHEDTLKIRARTLEAETEEDKSKYIMTLDSDERKADGSPALVSSFQDFQNHFSLFSESSLSDLDWSNVVAAGSAVTTALLPVPDKYAATKKSLREYYHEKLAPASDVDLFLYGLTEEQALEKIKQIEQSIKNSILHETTTIRTKNAITIASQYPTRHVQIVLRLYDSISQIITGFDVDCACVAFDGKQVYAAPRAITAFLTQCNTIDLSRRSPSYENRLSKYSHRGFEVHWPLLERNRIDPTIFERSFGRTQGLARLLILEKLPKTVDRDRYMDQRRAERGRPEVHRPYRSTYTSNIKEREEDEVAEWNEQEEVSSYHTMTVPYGQKYNASRINRLLYAKDLLLNAEWNQPKEREVYLHRHPCFFGSAEEVLQDCCGHCPTAKTDEEIEIADQESKTFISGRLSFIVDDPGRQEIGSFNPITDDEWTTMAYVGDTARLCQAIVDGDLEHVQDWCSQEGVDVNRRDYTGRTPLHLATMVSTPDVVQCLVDHGARLVARLVDGRTALHIAAARGSIEMVRTLMDKSEANEEEEEEKKDARRAAKRAERAGNVESDNTKADGEQLEDDDSSSEASEISLGSKDSEAEDSMTMGSFVKVDSENATKEDTMLDDSTEEPDFYSVDVVAWDYGLSPLHMAILNGHTHIINLLVSEYGADVLLPVKLIEPGTNNARGAIMTIVLAMTLPTEKAKEVVRTLVQLGANYAQADMDHFTAFHYAVMENNSDILEILLAEDRPVALSVINNIGCRTYDQDGSSPLATAIDKVYEGMAARLLDLGAKSTPTFDDWIKTFLQKHQWAKNQSNEYLQQQFEDRVTSPIVAAAGKLMSKTVHDLLAHGADPQSMNTTAYSALRSPDSARYNKPETVLDIVDKNIRLLKKHVSSDDHLPKQPEKLKDVAFYTKGLEPGTYQHWTALGDYQAKKHENGKLWDDWKKPSDTSTKGVEEKKQAISKILQELENVRKTLLAAGAKSFYDLHPNVDRHISNDHERKQEKPKPYNTAVSFLAPDMNNTKRDGYLELFNAAWSNDIETVEKVTLASWECKSSQKLEPPLKIAIQDHNGFSPFSIAVLRGHQDLAEKIIKICMTQYHKDDGVDSRQRWQMTTADDSDDSDDDSENALPIYSELVNDKFTIDNLGEVATLVKSDILPMTMIEWTCLPGRVNDSLAEVDEYTGLQLRYSLLEHAVKTNDDRLLEFLIGITSEQQARMAEDDDDRKCYSINENVVSEALRLGRTSLLADMIKKTGAGMSLAQLVKTSGVEYKKKSKYYQGLSVGGKKRSDWAKAPGEYEYAAKDKVPPLLMAARLGSMNSIEWFMSETPLRQYSDFGAANKEDKRIKTLEESGKSFRSTIGSWLTLKSNMVLHAAILYQPHKDDVAQHVDLIKHLISICSGSIEEKTIEGWTPLHVAVSVHRPDLVQCLLSAGAKVRTRDRSQRNIIHMMLVRATGAVQTNAEKLQKMLTLFDRSDLEAMFLERCDESPSALTPLAYWMSNNGGNYKKPDIVQTLASYSTGQDLEMINGEGDLPVHVAIKQTLSSITELLLKLKPSTLYRENSTGRTPLEIAKDMHAALCIEKHIPMTTYYYRPWNYDPTEPSIIKQAASEFVKPLVPPPEESKQRTMQICTEVDTKMRAEDKKRRLVSLFEANEVAKRVTSLKTSKSRWGGGQIVINGGLVGGAKRDAVDEWLTESLREVQIALDAL